MIQVLFFLRFRSQLKLAKEDELSAVEKPLIKAFEAAEGKTSDRGKLVVASFDEKNLGVWLNVITALETGYNLLKKNCPMPSGDFVFVIGKDIPDGEMDAVCRRLASLHAGSGIWCAPEIRKSINLYCSFENRDFAVKAGSNGFYTQIKRIENIPRNIRRPAAIFPLSEKIVSAIKREPRRNILFSGPEFIGKREGVYRFCASMKNIQPLTLRFRPNANVGAFADMLNPRVYAFLNTEQKDQKKFDVLEGLKTLIFRDRLREEYSLSLINNIKRFLYLLFDLYIAESKLKEAVPVLVLDNIQYADAESENIFLDVYKTFKYELVIYGTILDNTEGKSDFEESWESGEKEGVLRVFQKNIFLRPETRLPLVDIKEMSGDLWEMAYAFALLGKYFPGYMIPRLFEENGKNPALLIRVFALLSHIGAVDFIEDPTPRISNFIASAEKIIGNRKQLVFDFVKTCLFSALSQGKLSPCFNLVETLADFNETVSDALIWRALHMDILNGTCGKINKILADNRLTSLIGAERGFSVRYLFNAFDALMYRDQETIQKTFAAKEPQTASTLFQVQMLINRASWHLCSREDALAFEKLKDALHLNGEEQPPAKIYRLIALVKLLQNKTSESAEYITLAVKHAEKRQTFDELGIASYYEANIQYLTGNLSKAERVAHTAEHNAVITGCHNWAARARLLRGKLRFEFGFYQDALRLFEKTLENLMDPITDEVKNTLNAWIFRAKFFLEFSSGENSSTERLIAKFSPSLSQNSPLYPCLDMALFKIEASYLLGDYKNALKYAENLLQTVDESVPEQNSLWIERPDWRSGFAQGELLNIPEKIFWTRQASAYRSLALCSLGQKEGPDAKNGLQWLSSNKIPAGTDPNDAFYFYALYQITKESGAASLTDITTIAGIAFRRLQQRSLKIDAPDARKAFLTRPYWNNALMAAVKEHKLI